MALSTRCPQCSAVFKVVADQLRVRNGLVRCGECATVFDGRACLVNPLPEISPVADDRKSSDAFAPPPVEDMVWPPEPFPRETQAESLIRDPIPEPVITTASPAVLRSRADMLRHQSAAIEAPESESDEGVAFNDEPEHRWSQEHDAYDSAAQQDDEHEPQDEHTQDKPIYHDSSLAQDAHDDEGAYPDDDSPAIHGEVRYRYDGATDAGRAPPDFLDMQRQRRRRLAGRLWAVAYLVGLLVLLVQAAMVYRNQLANSMPGLRPVLEAICQPLDCSVGYVRRIERISVSASSLQPQPVSEARDDGVTRLVLNVVLRNRYGRAQEWPALALDLTDMSDTVVVRKVLLPDVYLPASLRNGPFAAGAEVTLTIPLELSGVQISGYQLDKFFP
jgi:predicted Zn finger-like uncharacterized protein